MSMLAFRHFREMRMMIAPKLTVSVNYSTVAGVIFRVRGMNFGIRVLMNRMVNEVGAR